MSPTLKSTAGGSLWAKISGSSPWSRPLMFGSAESEHPRLTNGEIISEEFQPMWSQSTNVTDRRTGRQTTCDRNTALCTKVHRAVKTLIILLQHIVSNFQFSFDKIKMNVLNWLKNLDGIISRYDVIHDNAWYADRRTKNSILSTQCIPSRGKIQSFIHYISNGEQNAEFLWNLWFHCIFTDTTNITSCAVAQALC